MIQPQRRFRVRIRDGDGGITLSGCTLTTERYSKRRTALRKNAIPVRISSKNPAASFIQGQKLLDELNNRTINQQHQM